MGHSNDDHGHIPHEAEQNEIGGPVLFAITLFALGLRLSFSLFSGHKTLTSNGHLIQEMASSGVDVNYPKNVARVCHYISANFRIEVEVTHGAFPCSIEVYSYPFTTAI
jgi:hypothetical protein